MILRSTRFPLAVWLYGTKIAQLEAVDNGARLTWTARAAERWGLGARVMSELLPIQRAGECPRDRRVTVFLSGLLAEGNLREHQAFDAGVTSDDVFGLIAAYGRDTAGALVFMPGEASPDRVGSWEVTTDTAIAGRLQAAGRYAGDGLESNSLAGIQPKIVLRRDGGRWLRCLGGAPSTHIVKLRHGVSREPDRQGGAEPDRLLALTTLNLALGNSEAHAKNISLLRHADGSAELAPACDMSMHAHHASFSDTFAMDVRGQRRMSPITGADLVAEGESWPLPRLRARRAVRETLEQLEQALVVIDRDQHPGVPASAWRAVRSRTQALLRSPP